MFVENKAGTLSRRGFIKVLPFAIAGVVFATSSDSTTAAPPEAPPDFPPQPRRLKQRGPPFIPPGIDNTPHPRFTDYFLHPDRTVPKPVWTKVEPGSKTYAIAQTALGEGEIYIAGPTNNKNYWIAAMDPQGNLVSSASLSVINVQD